MVRDRIGGHDLLSLLPTYRLAPPPIIQHNKPANPFARPPACLPATLQLSLPHSEPPLNHPSPQRNSRPPPIPLPPTLRPQQYRAAPVRKVRSTSQAGHGETDTRALPLQGPSSLLGRHFPDSAQGDTRSAKPDKIPSQAISVHCIVGLRTSDWVSACIPTALVTFAGRQRGRQAGTRRDTTFAVCLAHCGRWPENLPCCCCCCCGA